MKQHTPGPWVVGIGLRIQYKHGNLRGGIIAQVKNLDEEQGGYETMQANARLIAAAPEMLGALKKLSEIFDAYIDPENVINADILDATRSTRAIIAKAEGRKT